MEKIVDDILMVLPVFCPSRILTDINLLSLNSVLNYLKTNENIIDLVIGGWSIEDNYWDEILQVVEQIKLLKHVKVSTIKRFSHNYGKSYIVNKLSFPHLKKNKKIKYIFTMDSDIQFDTNEKKIFERMIFASKQLEETNQHPFGCLTLNLKPNQHNDFNKKNRHMNYKFEDLEEELFWDSEYMGGFAGGALFISVKTWNKTNGYKRYNQTYAPEDAFFHLCMNTLSYSFAIFKSLYVIHPETADDRYAKWKTKMMSGSYIIFDKFDSKAFLASVKLSEKFWRELNVEN